MLEIPRALRLGVVNIFGIAIPGFLILFFSFFGFFVPVATIALHASHSNWKSINTFYDDNTLVIVIIILLFSYVAGYILRLSSPDELDKVSADKVIERIKENEPDELEKWPYTGIEGDKFPYFNFQRYLFARDLDDLLGFVDWGPDPKPEKAQSAPEATSWFRIRGTMAKKFIQREPNIDEEASPGYKDRIRSWYDKTEKEKNEEKEKNKRSKTAVNKMKLDIRLHAPELTAVVESNEAHVRLMSGTWIAIKETRVLVFIGLVLCSVAALTMYIPGIAENLGIGETTQNEAPRYLLYALVTLFLLCSMFWAKWRIENLFHYRRVSELFYIVQSAHLAKQKAEAAENSTSTSDVP